MIVQNMIDACSGRHKEFRDLHTLRYLMIHRFGWSSMDEFSEHGVTANAMGVATFYKDNEEAAAATGSRMPYAFVIRHDGTIDQAAELGVVTPHARRFSIQGIGVAVLGDFRITDPHVEQLYALQDLCAALVGFWPNLEIVGHDELSGAASPKKKCPGQYLSVHDLRERVAAINEELAGRRLLNAGVVF